MMAFLIYTMWVVMIAVTTIAIFVPV